jgi:NADH:ubiquinone oxidoreductase subunit H
MLLIFFLCEYLHLIIASIHFVLFFLGGWMGLNWLFFLPTSFISHHNTYLY